MSEQVLRLILLLIGAAIILGILWHGLQRKNQKNLLNKHVKIQDRTDLLLEDEAAQIKKEVLDIVHAVDVENTIVEEEAPAFVPEDNEKEDEQTNDTEEWVKEDLAKYPEKVRLEQTNSIGKYSDRLISIRVMPSQTKTFGGYPLLQALLANKVDYGPLHLFHRYADVNKTKKLFSIASITEPGDFDLSRAQELTCDGLLLYMNVSEHLDPTSVFEEMFEVAQSLVLRLDGSLMATASNPWTTETTKQVLRILQSL